MMSPSLKEHLRYRLKMGWAETRGRRPTMEDTVAVFSNFRGNQDRTLLCCFDGHSGEKSAEYAARRLCSILASLLDEVEFKTEKSPLRNNNSNNNSNSNSNNNQNDNKPDSQDDDDDKSRFLRRRRSQSLVSVSAKELDVPKKIDKKTLSDKVFKSADTLKAPNKPFRSLYGFDSKSPPKNVKANVKEKKEDKREKSKSSKVKDKKHKKVKVQTSTTVPFNSIRKMSTESSKLTEEEYNDIFGTAFLEVHKEIQRKQYDDGTTAISILIEHDNDRIVVANCGDQRVVMARLNKGIPLSTDHKPDVPSEKERIYREGGFITDDKRVNAKLAVSRSLGDVELKPIITHIPDVHVIDIQSEDKFLIIACDGLWDVVNNQKAVDIANNYRSPARAAAALRDYAIGLGSTDNISVIVYRLDDTLRFKDLNSKRSAGYISSTGSGEGKSPLSSPRQPALAHSKVPNSPSKQHSDTGELPITTKNPLAVSNITILSPSNNNANDHQPTD